MYVGSAGGVDPTSALTMLLPAFAAAFLGSTTIMPGQFNPWGAFLSVYFLVTGITGLAILGLPTFVQSFFYGGALIIAVSLAQLSRTGGGNPEAGASCVFGAIAATSRPRLPGNSHMRQQ